MYTLSCMSNGYLNMKDYGETTLALSKTSPFTIVADAHGKEIVVRKSSICWLLNKNCVRHSSDNLQHVNRTKICFQIKIYFKIEYINIIL